MRSASPLPSSTLPGLPLHTAWLPRERDRPAEQQARAWLAATVGMPPDRVGFSRDTHGRPHLQPPLGAWDCNWSHSGEGLLVAAGEGLRIGVDLEWWRPRARALAIAERFFAAEEVRWLRAAPAHDLERLFLRVWCAKEAVLKAHGQGIAFGLHRLSFVEGEDGLVLQACDPALGAVADWRVRELVPAPGYTAALAWCPR